MTTDVAGRVLASLGDDEIIKLEQAIVRIPSPSYEETPLAEYLAQYMSDAGIDVELHEVVDPFGSDRVSKQPVGIIRGEGTGKSLMFNGHMDHNPLAGTWERDPFSGDIEGDWLYGRGSIDEKGGVTNLVMAGVAIKRSGLALKGDLLLCPVMGHKSGAIGTLHLMNSGIVADRVINTENTDLGIATRGVGVVRAHITFHGRPVHFRTPEAEKATAANPIEKTSKFVLALGPLQRAMEPGGWLTFEPDPDLPGFPQFNLDGLACERVPETFCKLDMQVRIVPGQSAETLRGDLAGLIEQLQRTDPTLQATLEVPPHGGWNWPPYAVSPEDEVVTTLAKWHEYVLGTPPEISAKPRLGAVGDANFLANAGIPAVQYGPGKSSIFKQWPTPNEKIFIPDLIAGAKVMALTAAELCGAH